MSQPKTTPPRPDTLWSLIAVPLCLIVGATLAFLLPG